MVIAFGTLKKNADESRNEPTKENKQDIQIESHEKLPVQKQLQPYSSPTTTPKEAVPRKENDSNPAIEITGPKASLERPLLRYSDKVKSLYEVASFFPCLG
jgi:hypothetical protein